jgi:hypothetical protein
LRRMETFRVVPYDTLMTEMPAAEGWTREMRG